MIVPFIYRLRERGVAVGTQEALALAEALSKGLHDHTLDGFYHVARALLIHSEADLDAFDDAFLAHFRGIPSRSKRIHDELLAWLQQAQASSIQLTEQQRALLRDVDPEKLLREFEQRLRSQKQRHQGGHHWIGTGGTSPFGHSGAGPGGVRVGGKGGNRSALAVASIRRFRAYRRDIVLDVRQMAVALRKLRAFMREGNEQELDLEATIEATAKNAGEIEVVTRPPRRPNTRVVLLMDVGGSMDPYAHLVSRLFSAASHSAHFKELRSYYFHNCIYGEVYESETLRDAVSIDELMASCGRHYKLIMVGDALMAPYELLSPGYAGWQRGDEDAASGLQWLLRLSAHFDRAVWLNPERRPTWPYTTIEKVAAVFPMFELTLEGLDEAVAQLTRGRTAAR